MRFLKLTRLNYVFLAVFFCLLIVCVVLLILQKTLIQSFGLNKSSANFFREDNKLSIKFNILERDKKKAERFFKSLGIENELEKGFTVGLDNTSLDKLGVILPVSVNLDFDEKQVKLNNRALPSLKSAFSASVTEISTGSGRLSFKANNETDYYLFIADPKLVLVHATGSGQLSLSKKVDGLFPILDKIGRIELRVDGKNINGFIELK